MSKACAIKAREVRERRERRIERKEAERNEATMRRGMGVRGTHIMPFLRIIEEEIPHFVGERETEREGRKEREGGGWGWGQRDI